MNVRIQELAEQAGFTMRKFYGGEEYLTSPETPIESYCLDSELAKFAQLIVRECTNIMLHYTDVDEGVAVAKKHFGVE